MLATVIASFDHRAGGASSDKIVPRPGVWPACKSDAIANRRRSERPGPPGPEGLDPRTVKALSHPLRYRILARLNAGVASPVEIAREMEVPIGRVSHHVRTLARLGAIELVRTRPRRGAVEHFYRAAVPAWFTDADWAALPRSARQAIGGQNVEQVVRDVVAAAGADGFGRSEAHLSFVPLELDEPGMAELADLLRDTLEKAYEIERRSGDSLRTELVLMHFERPPGG
jgi:DNA-binding transcriptional ArsR family regulator